nr:protein suppressor of K(+) transport growth defect 1-like [Tanacetum cinerariifolium]
MEESGAVENAYGFRSSLCQTSSNVKQVATCLANILGTQKLELGGAPPLKPPLLRPKLGLPPVNEVLFEPVRKTQDAMFFIKTSDDTWVPCGPRHPGAIEITMQDLATQGQASKITPPPISRTDFDKVLAKQKPTVSKSDLEVHDRFTREFGEEG